MGDVIVSKYGGSSITSEADVDQIARITREDSRRRVIVVSAPGKRQDDDKDPKVTDLLIQLAKSRDASLIERITERFSPLAPSTDMKFYAGLLNSRLEQSYGSSEELEDSLKAFGELVCAYLLTEGLRARGLDVVFTDAKNIFVMTPEFSRAKILPESKDRIKALKLSNILVIPGFYGATQDGRTVTLDRNSSDVSGAYLAAALDAIVYENFTDSPGMYVVPPDPDSADKPRLLEELTYWEARNLSASGFKLHQDAVLPAAAKGITIHVRGTRSYPQEGTRVVPSRKSDEARPIVGATYENGFCLIRVKRIGLNNEAGVYMRLGGIFADPEVGVSIEHALDGNDSVGFIVNEAQVKGKIGDVYRKILSVLGDGTSIDTRWGLGKLVVAGQGLAERPEKDPEIRDLLLKAGINVKPLPSPDERPECFVYMLDAKQTKRAIQIVYSNYLR